MKKATGVNYLLLALFAFGGLALEFILSYGIEILLYGMQMADWSTLQWVLHWTLTCIVWGVVSYILIRFAKNKYDFDILAKGNKMKVWQWIIVVALIIGSLIISYMNWNGSKVLSEFQRNGLARFIFQYIYYVFEILLVTLILVFGQKAFEKWFKKENIPYGGIIIAITWGLAHFFTKEILTGVISVIAGLAFGSVYLLVNRDIKKTYLILWIMFVL